MSKVVVSTFVSLDGVIEDPGGGEGLKQGGWQLSFFDQDQAPEISFESTKVAQEGDEIVVDGELAVKGTSKPVVARGTLSGPIPGPDGNERIGIDLETKVDRHDYGLDWNMDMPDGSKMLGDEVTLTVHLELIKEA